MITLPRYALAPPTFRFRAVVALADKLPLGGDREVALATWMVARLLWELGEPNAVAETGLRLRTLATRQWGQSLALPAAARLAFTQALDAIAAHQIADALAAWQRLLGLASRAVELAVRADRRTLEARLARSDA